MGEGERRVGIVVVGQVWGQAWGDAGGIVRGTVWRSPYDGATCREESQQVDIRIGIIHTGKELEVELGDGSDREKLLDEIDAALKSENGLLWLTDKRGRRVGIPAAKIAYVEVGAVADERRVGFGAN